MLLRLRVENTKRIDAASVQRALGDAGTSSLFPRNLLCTESLASLKRRLERDYIFYHYRRLQAEPRKGRTKALADLLGMSPRQLYRRCEHLGISIRELNRSRRPDPS